MRHILAAAVLGAASFGASAQVVEFQFTGADLQLNSGFLEDSNEAFGRDSLQTMDVFVDGLLVGSLDTDISFDLFFSDADVAPVGGGVGTTGGGLVDLFFDGSGDSFLLLDFDSADLFMNSSQTVLTMSGSVGSVFNQSLVPFVGSILDQPVLFSFSSTRVRDITDDGQVITGFTASGTGNVTGVIPAPGVAALGVAGGLMLVRRRR